jgi:hypothetical protein
MLKQGILVAAVAAVLAAAAAVASPVPQGGLVVQPNGASEGSHLLADLQGADAGFRKGQIPQSLAIAFQKGFVLDPTAVPGTCTPDAAKKEACPADSGLGGGHIFVSLNGGHYDANLQLFRGQGPQDVVFYFKEPQSGFDGATVGTVQQIDEGDYGVLLNFPKLPLPSLPPGFSLNLDRLQLDIGAGSATAPAAVPTGLKKHRKKKCTRWRKRHGHWRCVKRGGRRTYCAKYRKRHGHWRCVKYTTHRSRRVVRARKAAATSFIVNPSECTGTWALQLRWGYKDGTELREAAAPCTASGR